MTELNSVDAMIDTSTVKNHQAFLKCKKLINCYVITLSRAQTKIFESCLGTPENEHFVKEDFFNLSRIDDHRSMCIHFANACERSAKSVDCEELINSWNNLIKSLQHDHINNSTNREAIQASRFLVHFIIGFCLLEAKYYEAISCSWEHLNFCNFEDTTFWLVCFLCSYRLEDWQLLGIFLEKEKFTKKKAPFTAGYLLIVECFWLAYRFHTAKDTDEQILIADEVVAKLTEICKDDRRTFLYTQSKSILRSILVLSSRLPNSDLKKYNDPIYQRELEISHAMTILRTYDSEYFQATFSPIQKKMKSSDGFLKFCMAFVDYMEISISYCWDCWDVGLLREAESTSIALWRNNLIFGNAYWTLRSLSFLFFLKSSSTYDSHLLEKFAQCLESLRTPATSSSNHYLLTPKRNIRPSVFRRGSAVDDSFDMDNGSDNNNNNFDDELLLQEFSAISICKGTKNERKHFHWATHVSDCSCVFCISSLSNWAMALELDRLTLLFRRNSPMQFTLFKDDLNNIYIQKARSLRQTIFNSFSSAIKIEENINQQIPSLIVNYWVRAVCQSFVERSDETIYNRNDLEEALKIFKHSNCQITYRAPWLLLRHFLRAQSNGDKFLYTTCSPTKINSAQKDLRDYSNLFFREWRQRCAHFLIRNRIADFMKTYCFNNTPNNYAWTVAMCHIESVAPSMRQLARTLLLRRKAHKLKSNNDNGSNTKHSFNPNFSHNFTFKDVGHFKSLIERLPPEITFVNISMDEENVLWMTRCHATHEPVILRLCKLEKDDPLLERMSEILEASDISVKKSMFVPHEADDKKTLDEIKRDIEQQKTLETFSDKKPSERDLQKVKAFWEERKKLNDQLKLFLCDLQQAWLVDAAPLLLPSSVDFEDKDNQRAITRLMGLGIFSNSIIMILLQLFHYLNEQDWIRLAILLRGNETQDNRLIAQNTWSRIAQMIRQGSKKSNRKCYTLLVVPPALSHLPWECLPIFDHSPFVMRLPSFHIFEYLCTLEHEIKELPKMVNGRNSFYVLNPAGDLTNTQKRITDFVGQFNWQGLIGQVPSRDQIRLALTESELFLYIGHGSGGRYWRSTVRETDCNAVSILMGCSSVKIYDEGPGFDGRSSLYEYLIARCPCVIGCLWMVTDGEIDRFFMALMEYCFMESVSNNKKDSKDKKSPINGQSIQNNIKTDSIKLFTEAIVKARLKCRLPYLTGASVVAYGLPVAAAMDVILK